ncbi:hypothetical protein L207DRAFT_608084 [Hyaloscypha variabilis F]|uniref:Uncharacterized protein n=1 Tax=Hyaloscypha variabilis (strain UAMH 11265 / GT02V1 / F) TaxID=1149755 RepID=A0A2J6R4A5_HYAVF|nr:hypothetical protein L207DRAFT_608084 [Hyaloscypha variabilis F]
MGTVFLRLVLTLVVAVPCFASVTDLFKHVFQNDLRSNFENLIATNPNYFGNAPESNQPSVTPLSYDTQYEQLVSIGFDPILSVLEATIEIKLDYGFNGTLCTNGSFEYVRFYVRNGPSFKDWSDLGAVAVNTHDILNVLDCSDVSVFPLFYVLTLPFQPSPQQNCELPQLPEIRAILSWGQLPPPSSPFFAPVWGNALDQHIQSPKLPATPPSAASASQLRHSEERLHYPQGSKNQQQVLSEDPSTPPIGELPRPGGPENIFFEELIGLGLDYSREQVVATIRIKRPDGYGTGLCGNGTLEYIAFWADWHNTCEWTYLGELTINVHNIPNIPPDGVTYSAALPVDLRNVSHFCNTTQISRVRAVLSWDLPPLQPPDARARGNLLQVHVQIPPYVTAPNLTAPTIYNIGGVALPDIDTQLTGLTFPGATFPGIYTTDNPAHQLELLPVDPDWQSGQSRRCPFGGAIFITGPPIGSLGQPQPPGSSNCDLSPSEYQYRIVYRPFGSTLQPNPVLNEIIVTQSYPVSSSSSSYSQEYYPLNAQGYFNYLPGLCNHENILGWWQPPTPGLYQIRLEIATQTSSTPPSYKTEGYTDWYNIQVNIPNPTGTFIPTDEPVCGTFPKGSILTGTLTAQATYFASYSAYVINGDIPIVIESGTVPPVPNPGFEPINSPEPWSWNSAGAPPCGYVAQLVVSDRTIMDSVNAYQSVTVATFGFCVGPPLGLGKYESEL